MTQAIAQLENIRPESLWSKAWKRFLRHKLALFGLSVLAVLLFSAIAAPTLTPFDPLKQDLRNLRKPPTTEHWLGTDGLGRDILTRVLFAGRISLSVGLVSVSISAAVGILIGVAAGYLGGKTDMLLMRLTDMVMTFPSLVVIITVAAAFGPSVYNAMLIIGLLTWPSIARLVRGQFLSLRTQQFVTAARSIGVSNWEIAFKHIFPNTISSITVAVTFGMATSILLEASLSFLGLGVPPPAPSWGNMLRDAQGMNILEGMPWIWLPPGIMIALSVLSINFIGDGLRDALDPRSLL
ncbi:MAG: Glutathione transport system permease protein GsiD [Anaerolineales bacterium]|nr:Glutathione transport system permease protein GsiD [Anaerolineales bacterium]WKZ47091.1 MAG: ABC transporter permease [Anaerolineales bacterium]